MVKTLLLLLLLTTPATANNYITADLCLEMSIVLQEHVDSGYIKEQSARELIDRCYSSIN